MCNQSNLRLMVGLKKIPPPIIGLCSAACMWLLSTYAPIHHIEIPLNHILAATLAVMGLTIDLAALWSFKKAKTTVNPINPEKTSKVVTTGIYRYTRNPMYLGMLLLLFAFAIYLNTASPWLIPVLFVWVITVSQIKREEQTLEKLFGQDYVMYKQAVRRWL